MPGGVRWDQSQEPFSYTKLCFYYLPRLLVFLGIAALLISAFGGLQWLDQVGSWLPSSVLLYRCRLDRGVLLVLHEGPLETSTGQHSGAHSIRPSRGHGIEGRYQIILGPS